MKNLVLVRIDDRLIHGQVMTAWVKDKKAKNIVIIDNKVAEDDYMIPVLEMAAPKEVDVIILNEEEAIEEFPGGLAEPTIILVKGPEPLLHLVEAGIDIGEVDVAGMGMKEGRTTLYRNIAASESERETFRKLMENDVKVFVQIMPKDKPADIKEFL